MPRIIMAQYTSRFNPQINLDRATHAIKTAKEALNGDLIVFPEYFMAHPYNNGEISLSDICEPLNGNFVNNMCAIAKKHSIWTVFSINELSNDSKKPYNTTIIVSSTGKIISHYRKTHLFDAYNYKESDYYAKGGNLFTPIDTPFGKIGIMVCYDIRFPEVARHQALLGADIILAPSAFIRGENKLCIWESLLKARAIENELFIVATDHVSEKVFLGNSLAISPSGEILARGEYNEGLIPVDIDLEARKKAKELYPSLSSRRTDLYTLKA